MVPAVDNITVFGTDTLSLLTKSVQDDSVVSSLFISGFPAYVGAGAITSDAIFGKTKAEFYFQIRPPQDNYKFDKDLYQIDSAVLILPYSGFTYGDTNSNMLLNFKAFRMTEQIYFDSTYYASTPAKSTEGSPFATAFVSVAQLHRSRYDSVSIGGKNKPAHVRMRIDNSLMNDMIDKTGGAEYATTKDFINYFNGIYVTTDNSGNSVPYFNLKNSAANDDYSKAGVLMYYHTKNSSGLITDTLTVSYPYDPTASQTKTAFFNKISRDFNGSAAQSFFSSTTITDGTILVQNLPGAGIDLRIPNVKNLPLCIVNKAELVITQIASPMDALFQTPTRLYPEVINEDGTRRRLADRNPNTSITPLYFIDGNRRIGAVDGDLVNQYVLNFPRELQNAIVEQRKELRLRINGTQDFIGAYRLTAAGSNYSKPAYRIKLNVVYTKL